MPIYIFIDTFQTIDAIMIDAIKNIPVHMDFVGQGRAEKLYQIIIVLFGVVGLVWGFMIQQFSQTVYILGAGLLLSSLLTIPPWSIYRSVLHMLVGRKCSFGKC